MKKKLFSLCSLFLGLFLFFSLLVVAEGEADTDDAEPEETDSPLLAQIEAFQQELIGKELPGILGRLFGNQRISIKIESTSVDEEPLFVGIITEEKVVKSIVVAQVTNPTLEVKVAQAVLEEILNSQNPLPRLRKALAQKEITYKARGFGNRLRFAVVSLFTSFTGEDKNAPVEVVTRQEAGVPGEVTGGAVSQPKEGEAQADEKKDGAQSGDANAAADAESADEGSEETSAEEAKKVEEVPAGPKTHTVALIAGGFAVPSITIKVGDTVTWENVRDGVPIKGFRRGMIIGAQKCSKIKSVFFQPGESFSWTFDKVETCLIVDGLYTTQTMKVIVEK